MEFKSSPLVFCVFYFITQTIAANNTNSQNFITILVTTNSTGENISLDFNQQPCYSFSELGIPDEIKITGIDTNGNCVNLYEDTMCSQEMYYIITGNKISSSRNSYIWEGEFSPNESNRAIKSISQCENVCVPKFTNQLSQEVEVIVNAELNGIATNESLSILGCTTTPLKFKRTFTSWTHYNICLETYSDYNCTRSAYRYSSGVTSWAEFWDEPSPEEATVSLCGFKCNRESLNDTNLEDNKPPKPGTVIIYDGPDFLGNKLELEIGDDCLNLTGEWEKEIQSIQTFGICLLAYTSFGCYNELLGASGIQLNSFNLDVQKRLESRNFNRKILSLQKCSTKTSIVNFIAISPGILAFIIIAVLIIISSAVLIVYKLIQQNKNLIGKITEKEIQDFINGIESSPNGEMYFDKSSETFVSRTNENQDPLSEVYCRPLMTKYDIPKRCVNIDYNCVLGSGAYAIVYKGIVKQQEEDQDREKIKVVAIKTTKRNADIEFVRALLKEIKVMAYLDSSPYLIQLVGCCIQSLRNNELLVVTEICENGNLHDFIKTNSNSFVNLVSNGQFCEQLVGDVFGNPYENIDKPSRLKFHTIHLLQWCLQMSRGMEYLASKKVIHGDLASRNLLLDGQFKIKISDFGLSRNLYENPLYTKKNMSPLPWRWLAIESLRNMEFSTESDIWSCGITMWEIFTLGDLPYPGIIWNDTFLDKLTNGYRLPKPEYATLRCYNLMISCWNKTPCERISFQELQAELQEILTGLNCITTYLETE